MTEVMILRGNNECAHQHTRTSVMRALIWRKSLQRGIKTGTELRKKQAKECEGINRGQEKSN